MEAAGSPCHVRANAGVETGGFRRCVACSKPKASLINSGSARPICCGSFETHSVHREAHERGQYVANRRQKVSPFDPLSPFFGVTCRALLDGALYPIAGAIGAPPVH